jgi:chemotaxis protein methyltransferase CheR
MLDKECVHFLRWALPRLGLQWPGFRKVRRLVCKRINRRMQALGLLDTRSYRSYLEKHKDEWQILDSMCRISISRFFRDKGAFAYLADYVLDRIAKAALADSERTLHCWSAGCASGEEAYSLAIMWKLHILPQFPDAGVHIVGTDNDPHLLERARDACYPFSSVKNMPAEWLAEAFSRSENNYCLQAEYRRNIVFMEQDIRQEVPDNLFDLILCRNMAFTYFDEELQLKVLEKIWERLLPSGALVIGSHEHLPKAAKGFAPCSRKHGVYGKLNR